jgi:hypothetical protein
VIYVKNDEETYRWCLEMHPDGFVANLGTGGKNRAMLHTARCSHLYPPEERKIHTVTYAKACSSDSEEVQQWAQGSGFDVVPCPDCKV